MKIDFLKNKTIVLFSLLYNEINFRFLLSYLLSKKD